MTLKSALQDIKETTLSAVSGLLGKLVYLASLRRGRGRYEHWGLGMVHGQEAADRACKTAHIEVVSGILRTPIASLVQDVEDSSSPSGIGPQAYLEEMRRHFDDLLPEGRQNSPVPSHLNSVLLALWSLERNRVRATRSTS
jgi:hypothetical protein